MIVCLAANPSVDKLFEIERLVRGDIHRPDGFVQVAGGKGLNAARAAHALGASATAVALLRGHTGKWLEETARRRGRARCARCGPTARTASSLSVADRETGGLTEFYEHGADVPSVGVGRADARGRVGVDAGMLADDQRIHARRCSRPRLPRSRARRPRRGRARRARCRGRTVARSRLEAQPEIVKVNASEAAGLLGVPTTRRDDALAAAAKLRDLAGGDGHAGVVTRGAEGVVLAAPDGSLYDGRLYVRGRYPVGSGDAFLAGLVTALDRGDDWEGSVAAGSRRGDRQRGAARGRQARSGSRGHARGAGRGAAGLVIGQRGKRGPTRRRRAGTLPHVRLRDRRVLPVPRSLPRRQGAERQRHRPRDRRDGGGAHPAEPALGTPRRRDARVAAPRCRSARSSRLASPWCSPASTVWSRSPSPGSSWPPPW